MPDHIRKQIRDSVVAELAGVSTAAGRIYGTRRAAMDTLPAVAVYLGDEQIEALTIGQSAAQYLQREVEIIIEGYASAAADVENTLDQLAAEIETEMSDPTHGGITKDHQLTGITTAYWDDDANEHYALIRLTYSAVYVTARNAPTVAL